MEPWPAEATAIKARIEHQLMRISLLTFPANTQEIKRYLVLHLLELEMDSDTAFSFGISDIEFAHDKEFDIFSHFRDFISS